MSLMFYSENASRGSQIDAIMTLVLERQTRLPPEQRLRSYMMTAYSYRQLA
jgi:hypothetical protein